MAGNRNLSRSSAADSVGGSLHLLLALFVAFLASACLSSPAFAQWELTKIADFSTPIPGAPGKTFDFFGPPAMSGDQMAFYGRSGDFHAPNQVGIFVMQNGSLRTVADMFTGVPNGNEVNFERFDSPSINAGQISFWAQNPSSPLQEGIYTDAGGPLQVVADVHTPIPGGTGTFTVGHFSNIQSTSSGNVALVNWGAGQEGVFMKINGTLRVVANLSTSIPGGQGTFASLSGSLPFDEVTLSDTSVAFVGRGAGQEGIYSNIGGQLRAEVDFNTVLPGGNGNATLLRSPSLQGEDLSFFAFGQAAAEGIFMKQGGVTRVVADMHTSIPGVAGGFDIFDVFTSLDRGNVVFWGRVSFPVRFDGLFAYYGGSLVKIIGTDDILDGKNVAFLTIGPQALSGHRVAFKVVYSDFSQSLYVAVAPLNFHDGFESGDTSAWLIH